MKSSSSTADYSWSGKYDKRNPTPDGRFDCAYKKGKGSSGETKGYWESNTHRAKPKTDAHGDAVMVDAWEDKTLGGSSTDPNTPGVVWKDVWQMKKNGKGGVDVPFFRPPPPDQLG